jgi:hypothetical protein
MMYAFEQNWEENFKKLLMYESDSPDVPTKIREFYFGRAEPEEKFVSRANKEKFSKLFSDREYFVATHNAALAHAESGSGSVYTYRFKQPVHLSFADLVWNQWGFLPPVVEIGIYVGVNWVSRLFGGVSENKGT